MTGEAGDDPFGQVFDIARVGVIDCDIVRE